MHAIIFPGQGSQRRGMGRGLFDEVPEYATVEKEVDALLGYSIRRLCLEDTGARLNQTQYTQPSLYVVNALYWYRAKRQGVCPDYLAGHSLGEYNALLAAGAIDFLTGLRIIKKRGELMAQAKSGAMAAVIGLNADTVTEMLQEPQLSMLDVANYNSPLQTVVSGPVEEIKHARATFEKAGAQTYAQLPVSAAFHSRYMMSAAKDFANYLKPFTFGAAKTPVLANATGQPYPESVDSDVVKALLVKQITHSVQWTQIVQFLLSKRTADFTEMGPGNVLTRLVQQVRQAAA